MFEFFAHLCGDLLLSAGSVMIQSGGHGFYDGAGCVIVFESPDVCAAQAIVRTFVHVKHFEADGERILEVPERLLNWDRKAISAIRLRSK